MKLINLSHAKLKQHTATLHKQVDNNILMSRLTTSRLTQQQYANSLVALRSWYEFAENIIHQELDIARSLPHIVPKSPLITSDLQILTNTELVLNTGCFLPHPNVCSSSFYLGMLYVVEGSTLGGLLLKPALCKHFQREDLTHFYDCYRDKKIAFFISTMHYIEHNYGGIAQQQQLLDGAEFAFTALRDHLNMCTDDLSGIDGSVKQSSINQ